MSDNPVSPAAPPAQESASLKEGILGLLNVYIDPASTARRVQLKWFWVYPLIVISVVTVIIQLQMVPFTLQAMRVDPPGNMSGLSGAQLDQAISMAGKISTIVAFIIPVFLVGIVALSALLVMAMGAIVDARAKFLHVFNLLMVCGMISMLHYVATVIVLKSKGLDDIQSMKQLQVPLGLDIFINANGVLGGLLNYFSIFMIWYIVIMVFTYANMAKVSKGKAFFATLPPWIIGALFAMLGAMFRK
jgi:hypothetical protein